MKWILGYLALACASLAACGEDGGLVIRPTEAFAESAQLRAWYGTELRAAVDAESAKRIVAAERDIEQALSETDERKASAAIVRVAESGLAPEDVRTLLLRGPSVSPKARTGLFLAQAAVPGFEGKQVDLSVNCPAEYDPKRAWPLVVSLHGTLGKGDGYIGHWGTARNAGRYLIVAPSAEPAHGWGPSRFGRAQVLGVLAWARANYRVDPDRVYIEGMSMGGLGAKKLATVFADRLAAICSRSGPPLRSNQTELYRNLKPLGVLSLAGAGDPIVPLAALKTEDTHMRAAGIAHQFLVADGREHDIFQDKNDSVLEFFGAHKRTPYPEKLAFASYEDGWGASYFWMKIVETDRRANGTYPEYVVDIAKVVKVGREGGADVHRPETMEKLIKEQNALVDTLTLWNRPREAAAHLDREANAIVLDEVKGVSRLCIYVSEEMADLNREVSVISKGRTLTKKKIVRDVRFMLQEARNRGRRDQVWWGMLEVTPAK